jgi:flavin-dependent dehydrogenase
MTPPDHLDVIILGGGPAGSAAAIELALAGRRVALLERSLAAHDKVCGDFLSTEALTSLSSLCLNLSALPSGARPVPIHNVRLAGRLGISSATLPFAAQSLTRRTLDEALLQRASAAHALVLRGHSAESLHRTGNLWRVSINGPDYTYALTAPHVFLATGKHDLRGLPRPLLGTHADLVGLKMYLRLAPAQLAALRDTIELFLLPGGYGGLSLVEKPSDNPAEKPSATPAETNSANLCFVIRRSLLRDAGRGWDALSALLMQTPHLRTRLAGAEPLLPRPLAISPIPYGLLRRHAIAENLWAIGDQAAVIPSFTGDGLALALHSGRFAAHTLLAHQSAHHFHAELYTHLHHQLSLATILSRALVAQPQRTLLELTTRLFPGTLRAVASQTRLPSEYHIARLPKNSCAPA